MNRRLLILLPLLIASIFCGFAAAAVVLAAMSSCPAGTLLASAVLAGFALGAALEWRRAERALAQRRAAAAHAVPAVPCDLQ
ncbi:hypothetical protein [Stenotrophomonas bentonitica]|uniref:hypothetical protein n=1 Tax=Stenotrophomonas bentonitica TaxID=1450134 RepID=UPI00345E7CC6